MAALILAAPVAAAPKHYKVLGKARHHLGKPARHNLIAVRHGHRIHWFSKTHGLPKKKLPPIKMSANFRSRLAVRATPPFGPTSIPNVTGIGSCDFSAALMTQDGMSFEQTYGALTANVLNCVGDNGGAIEDNAFYPGQPCVDNAGSNVQGSQLELARFTDGEWMALCTVPDRNNSGDSGANDQHAPYVVYQQGFTCEVAIGVGSDGNTAFATRTKDSVEYSQTYTEDGQTVTALTTSCIGKVPSGKTAPSDMAGPVAHLISCTQYDPKATGKVVKGLGETITYPNGQFQETCNVPNYTNSVACTSGTNCETDVGADGTSNLDITEIPTSDGTLTETVDNGSPLICGDGNGDYPGFDPNWYGFTFTGTGSKQITYDLFGITDRNFEVCFGATEPFQTNDGTSNRGTLPDGTPGFIGLLDTCSDVESAPTPQPCIEFIGAIDTDTGPGGTRINVQIPAGFGADPHMHA